MRRRQIARRHQRRYVRVRRAVAVRVHLPDVAADRRQAVPAQHLVERPRVGGKAKRAKQLEQPLREGVADEAVQRVVVLGELVRLPPERAPVGVGDHDRRHAGQLGACRQREAEVTDDDVGADPGDRRAVLFDVPFQRGRIVHRRARREPCEEDRGRQRPEWLVGQRQIPEQGVVARVPRQVDVEERRIQRPRQRQRAPDVCQCDRLGDEQDARPPPPLVFVAPRREDGVRIERPLDRRDRVTEGRLTLDLVHRRDAETIRGITS